MPGTGYYIKTFNVAHPIRGTICDAGTNRQFDASDDALGRQFSHEDRLRLVALPPKVVTDLLKMPIVGLKSGPEFRPYLGVGIFYGANDHANIG